MNDITRNSPDLRSAAIAGLIAGVVFLVLELIMVPVFGGGSPWGPPRMIAAIALGTDVLPPPATFDAGIVLVALLVHFALSIIFAMVFAVVICRVRVGAALALGTLGGLALYLINFYGFTAVFPWFAEARNWISVFAHLVFGLGVGFSYKALERPAHAHAHVRA